MSRVRVLHLVVGGDIGGAERLLSDIATRPDASGADHHIALITPNPALISYFENRKLRVHAASLSKENALRYLVLSFGRADVRWLLQLVRETRAQVIHTHTFGSHVLGSRAAVAAGVPELRTEHHVAHYFDWDTSVFTRLAARRTRKFAAISEYVLETLQKTSRDVRERGVLVRNGVDTDYWDPRRVGIEPVSPTARAAIVCRLTAWKRVDVAIRAAALASIPLTVVGDGAERNRLELLAASLNADVTFTGQVEDPRPYVLAADMVLSTARNEPFGLSIVEALALGRPVVGIRGGGVTETVRHGEWGLLVDTPSPVLLATEMRELASSRSRALEMGAEGRRFVEREFNVSRMCGGYANLYRTLSEST